MRGAIPYPGLNNSQIYDYLESKNRMQCPVDTPEPVANLIKQCWEWEAMDRPTFNDAYSILSSMAKINEGKCYVL